MNGQQDEKGRFVSGNIGGPGRPRGSRNKLSDIFFDDLYSKWQEKGKEAIDKMIESKPSDFVRCVASVMPKEFNLAPGSMQELSDDEVMESLAAVRALMGQRLKAKTPGATGPGSDTVQ